jgi:putative heme-binding domain-containing protein
VDGTLDEAVYGTSPAVSDFIETEPTNGQPAKERTDVWVFFDDDNVYIVARCWESEPNRAVANEMRRDANGLLRGDHFGVSFDTFFDRRSAVIFNVNALGGRADGQVSADGQYNGDWNPVWHIETGRFEGGWVVEASLPFKTLRYRPGREQTWGINARRRVVWNNEITYLSAVPAGTTSAGWSAALSGLTHGLKLSQARRLKVPAAESALSAAMRSTTPELQQAAWEAARYFDLPALIQQAAKDALSASLPVDRRATAVLALRGGQFPEVSAIIGKILDAHPSAELQAASIDALSAFDDPSVGLLLLSHWKSLSPEGRKKTVVALLSRRDRVPLLLKAMERRDVEASALDPAERSRLIGDPDGAIAKQARQLLQTDSSERARVVTAYRSALTLEGNVAHGKKVFDDNCAKCHMPRKMGGRVGPDLSGINNKTKEELLTSILNPSYAIEPRFVNYMVTTREGQMYDGVIANETPGSVTLRGGSEEGDQTILRSHIADIRASSISLMPEGLEDSMNRQDISDVIAYLRGGL